MSCTQCSQGVQVFGKKFCRIFLPQYYEIVLWQKKFYLLRAALCHEESLIGNVWLASADPRKLSKVARSCKFLKYHKKHKSVL